MREPGCPTSVIDLSFRNFLLFGFSNIKFLVVAIPKTGTQHVSLVHYFLAFQCLYKELCTVYLL